MTLATPLSTTAERVAAAMIAIADAEMARALRRLSVDRGIDPRHAVLIPFGGGGPLHACGLAERMGMSRVLVPPHAGVLSALGLAIAAEHRTAVRSVMRSASMCDESFVQSVLTALSSQVRSDGATDDAVYSWWARCRYQGQGHELEQAVRPGDAGADVAAGFAATHALRYGFTLERDVQIVSMRCVAETAGRSLTFRSSGFEAERRTIRGRATLVLPDATMLVAEHWTATPHASGGWMMERDA